MTHFATLWHKAYSWWCELYLGIDTRGAVAPPTSEGVHYTPLPYALIAKMFERLDMQPEDVFVDVGCGKGRVVCCASRLHIRKVVAIELNPALARQASDNLRRVRGKRAAVEVVEQSAEEYGYSDATVIYLYNPFNARLTDLVVQKLFLSLSHRPRPLRIVYANPVHEPVLQRQGWLEKYAEWPASDFPVFGYPVSFWRSITTYVNEAGRRAAGGSNP
jgi:SAM-dependent methyltransferase